MYFESTLYSNLYIPNERIAYLIYVKAFDILEDNRFRFLIVEPVDVRMPSNTFRHAWITAEMSP